MLNFCRVRMVGAFKIHLIPSMKQFCLLKQLRNNVLETVKNILFYVNYLKSYVLFRLSRADELVISAAMEACVLEESIVKQEALIPQLVNGVQDPGFTPHEEFMLRSAPTVAPSVPCVHQVPDISRKTFSALKDQIRINRGRAREFRMQAAEKEEDSKRSEQEEWRLSYQADELDGKLVKLCRQESCLNRKISNLRAEETRLSTEKWQTEIVISEANLDIQL